jgi:UDP-glucose:(heptosyl)LPS alpha-1,3-glucosyltransferase
VLLEAVVAGLPVLTTASCGYAFHVENAGAGLVCPEPFAQAQLNARLRAMLEGGREGNRAAWRERGIAYGRTHDLYSMPRQVAALLLGEDDSTSNGNEGADGG